MFSYRVSGLAVASEIDLPGLIPGDSDCAPEVTIRREQVPIDLVEPVAVGPTWQRTERQFLVRIPDVARFLLEDGRSITFESESGAGVQDVAVFLSGSVFGMLLHQRNLIVLHASAVLAGGKAVLFCGQSGAGKSTLAAALGERGYPLVADDQCAIEVDAAGGPRIHPDGRQLRLWEKSIRELGLGARQGPSMRNRLRKFYVDPVVANEAPVAIGAVYILEEIHGQDAPEIERPNIVDATRLLTANAYRPMLIEKLGQRDIYFHGGTMIAARAGVFRLRRRFTFDAMATTVAMIEDHWAAIGLTDGHP